MKKVLIIEDEQVVANVFRNKLVVEGYLAEIALDGESGLKLLHSYQPDAVVIDLILPKMSGIEVVKKIRSEPENEKLPIIVLANTYLTNLIQDVWKAGATKCVSKINCSPKDLLDLMRRTIGGGEVITHARSKTGAAATGKAAPSGQQADAEFQAEFRGVFMASVPGTLATLRTVLQNLIKADNEAARLDHIRELYLRIHRLNSNAGISGLVLIAHMAAALEALLKELCEKPKKINASILHTVAAAVDFLDVLFKHGIEPDKQEIPKVNILVVDDEALACRTITYALKKAQLQSVSVEDPNAAYKLLAENKFDLIFLDVDMPGMTGFELCNKLRNLPLHKKTPVVFVTRLDDFSNRTKSMVAGGNDFIAKPFLYIELTVKALIHVLRGKLQAAR